MADQIVFSQDEIIELQRIARVTLYTRIFLLPSVVGVISIIVMFEDVHKGFMHLRGLL